MRERLIELIKQAEIKCATTKQCEDCEQYGKGEDCINYNIADYLLENGVIVLPCKVGDLIWVIEYCRCGNPEAFEMRHCHKKQTKKTPKCYAHVMIRQDGKRMKPNSFGKIEFEWRPVGTICYKLVCKPFKLEYLIDIGKTVFLTREAAENALKEREKT